MGLFNKIFGDSNSEKIDSKLNWNDLNELDQLDILIEESEKKAILIFKHSTRCGISRMVLNGFERDFDTLDDKVKLYYLDILNYRDLSNEISSRFGIWHESPQLLIFRNGKVVYHASHGQIDAKNVEKFI
jgi:bacillithiol system protein YtxJ